MRPIRRRWQLRFIVRRHLVAPGTSEVRRLGFGQRNREKLRVRGGIIARRWKGLRRCACFQARRKPIALTDVAAERDLLAEAFQLPLGDEATAQGVSTATWDEALVQTQLAELLSSPARPPRRRPRFRPSTPRPLRPRPTPIRWRWRPGLSQLNKYLNKTWYRAGIPVQLHDDSSQAVYAALCSKTWAAGNSTPWSPKWDTGA